MWAVFNRIKYVQTLYSAGIILIVAYSAYDWVHVSPGGTSTILTPARDTITDLLIKPIVTSEHNIIIFRGLFYLFVWMLMFLVIPVAKSRLTKFKLFHVEFEVATEKAALQYAIVTTSKVSLMEYLTSHDVFVKTLDKLSGNTISYVEVAETLLEDIQTAYRDTFNAEFTYKVYEDETPKKVRRLAENSIETKKGVIWNKPNNDNPFGSNLLVHHYALDGDHYILTVLSSYSTQFDTFDQHMLPILHNIITKNIESIELLVAASASAAREPDV